MHTENNTPTSLRDEETIVNSQEQNEPLNETGEDQEMEMSSENDDDLSGTESDNDETDTDETDLESDDESVRVDEDELSNEDFKVDELITEKEESREDDADESGTGVPKMNGE